MQDRTDSPQILFLYMGQDDPKKSTMRKLQRLGLARQVDQRKCSRSLALTPYADKYLLRSDYRLALSRGLCVIDGSWNRISSISVFHPAEGRNLPIIVPSNPVNFGKPGKLGSVESVAAALYIMGFVERAEVLMSKFKWGPNFLVMNRELLDDYARCGSRDELMKVQDSYF